MIVSSTISRPHLRFATENPLLAQVHAVLPRLLASFDNDSLSPTRGMGDRFYWGWKCIDFGNATFQGVAHGFARLVANNLLPDWLAEDAILRRIDAMFDGAARLTRSDGSQEEAFPYEGSFCVTALVAYDLLSAIELLGPRLDQEQRTRYLDIVRPMIDGLHRIDETHAIISNHLATGVAALLRWHALTGESGEARALQLLDIIRREASAEGWFREYDGADPGYQTLCTYYLADVHRLRPDLGLLEILQQSIRFLWHFAHPDGSFGGHYGSRNTRFFFPAGVEALAREIPEAAALANFMAQSIGQRTTVTLDALDASGIVPMFNAYCWGAAERAVRQTSSDLPTLPAFSATPARHLFPQAGLLVDRGADHYTIVSLNKGGVVYHFADGSRPLLDTGAAYKTDRGDLYTSQALNLANEVSLGTDSITIDAELTAIHQQLPTPWKFVVLRMMNVTVMRWRPLREFIKRALVRYLITGKSKPVGRVRRVIHLGSDLSIDDTLHDAVVPLTKIESPAPFKAIHMASSGYWQKQDDAA